MTKQVYHIVDQIAEARDKLRSVMEQEQRAYDALPEDLQMSAVGDAMENKIERLIDGMASMNETLKTLCKMPKTPPD